MKEKLDQYVNYALGWVADNSDKFWFKVALVVVLVWLTGLGNFATGIALGLAYIVGTISGAEYALKAKAAKKEKANDEAL